MSRNDSANLEAISARNRAAKARIFGKAPEPVELPPPKMTVRKEPKNKFGAVKSSEGDSRKEVRRLQELRLLQQAGQISGLIPQVTFQLIPAKIKTDGTTERAMTYTCDALYVENGKLVIEDTKSEVTRKLPAYIAKRKLILQLFDVEVRET